MSLFSRLFGGGRSAPSPAPEPESYKDCRIIPDPLPEGATFRLAARIEKEIDGQTRSHRLVRADTFPDRDSAASAAALKARQVIDEQGDRLFG